MLICDISDNIIYDKIIRKLKAIQIKYDDIDCSKTESNFILYGLLDLIKDSKIISKIIDNSLRINKIICFIVIPDDIKQSIKNNVIIALYDYYDKIKYYLIRIIDIEQIYLEKIETCIKEMNDINNNLSRYNYYFNNIFYNYNTIAKKDIYTHFKILLNELSINTLLCLFGYIKLSN
jgi:hypothetical protein